MAERRNSKGQFSDRGNKGERKSSAGSPSATPKRDHIEIRHPGGTVVRVPMTRKGK